MDVRQGGGGHLGANLIVHHSVADICDKAFKLLVTLNGVRKPGDFASVNEWGEVLENSIEFPINPRTSD